MSSREAPAGSAGQLYDGRLRRSARVRKSREFRGISQRARRSGSAAFVVLVASRGGGQDERLEGSGARIGLTVSRKVGGAVVRNRVKRRVREWFRRSSWRRGRAVDVVVIARAESVALSGEQTARELERLVGRLSEHSG